MYHSITFGEKNTWDDWHLIPKSRPVFNPPAVKTRFIEIPGGNGSLDLTSALLGRAVYKNRTGSFEFIVENGFKEWSVLYSEITNYLSGKRLKAILEDDPNYYYEGRFAVNEWKSEANWSSIVIDYDVKPYKKNIISSGDDWLWDTFNFETDVIRSYENLPVTDSLSVTIIGDSMPISPTIIVSSDGMTVTFEGETYALSKGTNYIPELIVHDGENVMIFTGTGTVTIKCERGRL